MLKLSYSEALRNYMVLSCSYNRIHDCGSLCTNYWSTGYPVIPAYCERSYGSFRSSINDFLMLIFMYIIKTRKTDKCKNLEYAHSLLSATASFVILSVWCITCGRINYYRIINPIPAYFKIKGMIFYFFDKFFSLFEIELFEKFN